MKTKTKIRCDYHENDTLKTLEFTHEQLRPVQFPQAYRLLRKRGIESPAIKYLSLIYAEN